MSIAIGLVWNDVPPRIEAALVALPEVEALIYEPDGPPPATEMPMRTERRKS